MAKADQPFADGLETIAEPDSGFEDDAEWLAYPDVGTQVGGTIVRLNHDPNDNGKHFCLYLREVDEQDVEDSKKGKIMFRQKHAEALLDAGKGPGDPFLLEGIEEVEFETDEGETVSYVSAKLRA